jgi:hypothetical protein
MQYVFVFTPIEYDLFAPTMRSPGSESLSEGVEIPALPPNLLTLRDIE